MSSDDEAPDCQRFRSGTESRRRKSELAVTLVFGVVLATFAAAGIWLALANNTRTEAQREIGGALVSSALIGAALLTFEEIAERRRQGRQDRREHAASVRADELALWAKLVEACHQKLTTTLTHEAFYILETDDRGDDVRLVSVMAANSETGVLNDLEPIAAMAHKHGALVP